MRSLPWPLVVALGAFALVRPLLSITGLADDWGRPATPLVATAVITLVWVLAVVVTRQTRPVATLLAAGLVYAALSVTLSAILSPILEGELQGPLTNPFAVISVAVVNVAWGAVAGVVALPFTRRSRDEGATH
ncbi:hypothetical protein [Nocardioides sp. SYSU DS0651]|uniref:hypothetical protein n=1 Tax=Nocardioides sp. SYSU DS0651 TaxID=3415955 RepID=UPI003F4C3E42